MYKKIKLHDKAVQIAINGELKRQTDNIVLIASENYTSNDVMQATGSVLTNKYAEGYAQKRYYDGTEFVDQVETLAITRAQQLFGVKYVNVQPHSGSTANAAAIAAAIQPGQKILGLALDAGGHLTHGYKVSFSGKFYKTATYSVNRDGYLDYDAILAIAKKAQPQLIICGFSAYPRRVDFEQFRKIADQVGALLLADIAHIAGLVATGAHPSPVGIADIITTTTHKTLRGARGGMIMTNDQALAKQIDRWVFPGYQGGPLMHSIAGKAVTFYEALKPSFATYIKRVVQNSHAFAQAFISMNVAVITGGTDTHLFTINVKDVYKISGQVASKVLEYIGIIVNKNTIPNDTETPVVTSGLRLGSAAMTSRGFTPQQFQEVAKIIDTALVNYKQQTLLNQLKSNVRVLSKKFPIQSQYL